MPGPSKRKRQATKHPLAPTPDPQEGINPRLEELKSEPDENRVDDDHTETEEEQQARESEKAFDQAITRIPPG
jgi:hypothetical protein